MGSSPSWAPIGSSAGKVMIMAGSGSRIFPTRMRNTFTVSRTTQCSSEMLRMLLAMVAAMRDSLISQLNGPAAASRNRTTAMVRPAA
ncbi:hypothetical protein D9M68_906450 [compost metagenome]